MPQLERCGFILFLNKRDVFERQLAEHDDFQIYFKRFMGEDTLGKDKKNKRRAMTKERSSSNVASVSLQQAEKVVASRFAEIVNDTYRQDDTLYCR